MERILVPTDFSKFADFATDMAISIAKMMDAEVHLVHLMDIPVDWIKLVEQDQKKLYPDVTSKVKTANSKLDTQVYRIEKAGLKAKRLIQYNSNYTFFKHYINTYKCDFVVMGSHGVSGFKEWFVGSNTQKVVRSSEVPVLIIKSDVETSKFNEIVFVSEFDRDQFNAFKWVLDFARMMTAKVHLLFINMPSNFTETRDIKKKMEPFIIEGGEKIVSIEIYNCYDFEEGLSDHIKDENQLVAMVTHGTKNSLTESVINHLDAPVLSVRL